MFHYIKDHFKPFWGGFVAGVVPVGGIVFSTPPVLEILWVGVVLKLLVVAVCGAVSGMVTALVTDIYNYYIKPKIFKKDDKERKKDKAA